MSWQPTIQHNGDVTYRLCPTFPPTEECFKANVLGTIRNTGGRDLITGKVKIPDVQCDKCTVSWYWEGGNDVLVFLSFFLFFFLSSSFLPSHLQFHLSYSNCADVQILAVGETATNGTSGSSSGMSKGGAVFLAIFLTTLVVLGAVAGVTFYLLKIGKIAFSSGSSTSSNSDYSRLSTA
jgi:hypothetical protein